jgi:hypothetical protein
MTTALMLMVLASTNGDDSTAALSASVPDDSVGILNESVLEEDVLDRLESESDELQLLDELTWREENPFDLNEVTALELETLPGVTPFEAAAFARHRDSVGFMQRKTMIRQVPEVGRSLYRKIAQYVIVTKPVSYLHVRTRTTHDLQPRQGAIEGTFVGPSVKSYSRIGFEAQSIQAGVVLEKDAGERIGDGFVSGFASVRDPGLVREILVGDFSFEAAEGMVLSRGGMFGKGGIAGVLGRLGGRGFRPYRSTEESNFFRGGGVSLGVPVGFGAIKFSAFYSRRSLDATLDESGNVTGFYDVGYFRTESERDKRRTVTDKTVGGRLEFGNEGNWGVGTTAYASSLDKPVVGSRAHEFSGKANSVVGIDGSFSAGIVKASAEVARSRNQSFAGVASVSFSFGPAGLAVFRYRNYSPAFYNRHGGGFGERSGTSNERGWYAGAQFDISPSVKVSGYIDHFQFPWRTFLTPVPTSGNEIGVQSDAELSRIFNVGARVALRNSEESQAGVDQFGRETRLIVNLLQQKYRLTLSVAPSRRLIVKGRWETVRTARGGGAGDESGYLFFQDVRYFVAGRLSVDGRLMFFHTDSYESRVYEYESDLTGVFSNPPLYGRGRRWYLVVRYNIADWMGIAMKYAETEKEGVTSLGSGLTEISGPFDNRLSLQVDLSL